MRVYSVASVVFNSLQPCGLEPARLLCPWDPQGKDTGVGCHALLWVWGRTWIDAKETEFDKILMKARWLAAAPV